MRLSPTHSALHQQRDRGPDRDQPGRRRRCRPGHRTVNDSPTAVPCDGAGLPENCVPEGATLDIPNVTTDFGLSPPYNGMFALFGQFFDHGVDFTKKTKNVVMMPLAEDDPLYVPGGALNFMLLSRAENQAGPDGELWVTRTIPGRHQHRFALGGPEPDLRVPSLPPGVPARIRAERERRPVANGELIEGEPAAWPHGGPQDAGTGLLGLGTVGLDVADIPKIATDQYGRFLRGPNGLPQYETARAGSSNVTIRLRRRPTSTHRDRVPGRHRAQRGAVQLPDRCSTDGRHRCSRWLSREGRRWRCSCDARSRAS